MKSKEMGLAGWVQWRG